MLNDFLRNPDKVLGKKRLRPKKTLVWETFQLPETMQIQLMALCKRHKINRSLFYRTQAERLMNLLLAMEGDFAAAQEVKIDEAAYRRLLVKG